ncbi:LysR family transcriptional regulator [Pseudoduganella violacea]|uniref:DNA-binding transcriptional LysR family regulator n=1 Tax=Pseudoduganella violacea TaxID=1715466 RepID=A0A7W5FTZ4_9BURK|nr:LysR family transcriptional regulator [Pseudoduganella violacea]MBB3119167.1 DNA-binding transcriptional LysR family regulator [Pseudoduganella violacea]
MDTIRSLHFFVRAVELGSFSAVAREQNTTQPTVSKVLAALEDDLGVRLLERSTASLSATAQGRRFYERAKAVLDEYAEAVADVRGEGAASSGLLRVNAPVALGQFSLNSFVQDFLRRYPAMEVELILNDRMVDMVEEGMDVVLRHGRDLPQNAVARRVGSSPRWLVASPAYLRRHPAPRQPQELVQHNYIRYAWSGGSTVVLRNGEREVTVQTQGRYRVNNALAIRDSLLQGSGIALCPAWLVHDLVAARQLRHVMPKWCGEAQELHLLYPSRRYQPARARMFIEQLQLWLQKMPGME